MSDDNKNPNGVDGEKEQPKGESAPLPGVGSKPDAAPVKLPGLGAKPGAAPLPGIASKAGAAPVKLPGLKSAKGAAALPGLGGSKKSAPVPPFMQKKAAEAEKMAQARDPFGGKPMALSPEQASRMTFTDGGDLIGASTDPSVTFTAAEAGKARLPLLIGGIAICVVALLLGYLMGKALSTRAALNISIRDALIVEYELKKVGKLFSEAQTMVNTAFIQASQKHEYYAEHLNFLSQNIKGNPVKPSIFTERNYKNFDAAAVQWLAQYNTKWSRLYDMIEQHRRQTENDKKTLEASKAAAQKAAETNYGIVFNRDSKQENKFMANIVIVGACEPDKDKMMCTVQAETGTYSDQRELYNPPEEDAALTKEPDKYVVEVSVQSRAGILQNASQSHFKAYVTRLKGIVDLMNEMTEIQKNLLNKLTAICSQDPVKFLGGISVEKEVSKYIEQDKSGGAEAPTE